MQKNMKVLVVSQCFWPENFRINSVAISLLNAGCSVGVITGQPNYPAGEIYSGYSSTAVNVENWCSIPINRVPIVCRGNGSALRLILNYLSFIASAAVFGPYLLRGQKFDVIFIYGTSPILQAIPAILLARLKGAAVVLWVQDLWPESLAVTGFVSNSYLLKTVAAVVRWIYRRCDMILVQSEAFVTGVASMSGTVPVEFHPNPGEVERGSPDDAVPVLQGRFNIVFAGNLGTVQALDTVLAAAALLTDLIDVNFVFVGDGTRAIWLANEITRLKLRSSCTLLGRLPASAMPGVFAQASGLLVTLTRDLAMASTIPSKLQSYLAAGRPVIAALDGEGARVVMAAGAGFTCPAENATALAEAIRRLYALSDAERNRFGVAGRNYYDKHYAPMVLTPKLVSIFEKTLKQCRQKFR